MTYGVAPQHNGLQLSTAAQRWLRNLNPVTHVLLQTTKAGKESRSVLLDGGRATEGFAANMIKTAKYNPITFLPIFLFSIAGGVVSDRFDRRRVVIVTHVLSGILAAALAVSPWLPVALVVPGGYVVALVVGSALIEPELAARSRALLPAVLAVMHLSWGVGFITSRVREPA